MKYKFIEDNSSTFHVEKMCQVLDISRSSYYGWKKNGKSKRAQENEILLTEIKKVYKKNREVYGSPRITKELQENNISCSHNRVEKIMKENNIIAKTKRKFKITTMSKNNKAVAEDLLKKDFTTDKINKVWTSDITYIWTREGWLYLTVILDMFSRKIISWTLEKYLNNDIVIKALLKALNERKPNPGLIFHSDKGIQYSSIGVKKILKAFGIRQSMSHKGNCYGNAITETFFHTIKTEHIYFQDYETRESVRLDIFEYIEIFYNRERRHSSLDYKSPDKFERLSYGGKSKVA